MSIPILKQRVKHYRDFYHQDELDLLKKMEQVLASTPPRHELNNADQEKLVNYQKKVARLRQKIEHLQDILNWFEYYSEREEEGRRAEEVLARAKNLTAKAQRSSVLQALDPEKPMARLLKPQVKIILDVLKIFSNFERSLTISGAKLGWLEKKLDQFILGPDKQDEFWAQTLKKAICSNQISLSNSESQPTQTNGLSSAQSE